MGVHLTHAKAGIVGGAAVIGGFISELFGSWDTAIMTLVIFMALDYVSGLIVAGVFHESDKTQSGWIWCLIHRLFGMPL